MARVPGDRARLERAARVDAAATAIANRRGLHHSVPRIANVLEMLGRANRGRLATELLSDAQAALKAAERIRTEESNRRTGEAAKPLKQWRERRGSNPRPPA